MELESNNATPLTSLDPEINIYKLPTPGLILSHMPPTKVEEPWFDYPIPQAPDYGPFRSLDTPVASPKQVARLGFAVQETRRKMGKIKHIPQVWGRKTGPGNKRKSFPNTPWAIFTLGWLTWGLLGHYLFQSGPPPNRSGLLCRQGSRRPPRGNCEGPPWHLDHLERKRATDRTAN